MNLFTKARALSVLLLAISGASSQYSVAGIKQTANSQQPRSPNRHHPKIPRKMIVGWVLSKANSKQLTANSRRQAPVSRRQVKASLKSCCRRASRRRRRRLVLVLMGVCWPRWG